MFSLLFNFIALGATTATLALAQAQDPGYIVKWHPGHVAPENRRTWIDNQLRKASLPELTDEQADSLKVSGSPLLCGPRPPPLANLLCACYYFRSAGTAQFLTDSLVKSVHKLLKLSKGRRTLLISNPVCDAHYLKWLRTQADPRHLNLDNRCLREGCSS